MRSLVQHLPVSLEGGLDRTPAALLDLRSHETEVRTGWAEPEDEAVLLIDAHTHILSLAEDAEFTTEYGREGSLCIYRSLGKLPPTGPRPSRSGRRAAHPRTW